MQPPTSHKARKSYASKSITLAAAALLYAAPSYASGPTAGPAIAPSHQATSQYTKQQANTSQIRPATSQEQLHNQISDLELQIQALSKQKSELESLLPAPPPPPPDTLSGSLMAGLTYTEKNGTKGLTGTADIKVDYTPTESVSYKFRNLLDVVGNGSETQLRNQLTLSRYAELTERYDWFLEAESIYDRDMFKQNLDAGLRINHPFDISWLDLEFGAGSQYFDKDLRFIMTQKTIINYPLTWNDEVWATLKAEQKFILLDTGNLDEARGEYSLSLAKSLYPGLNIELFHRRVDDKSIGTTFSITGVAVTTTF